MVFRQSDLHRLIKKKLSGHKIVVVANREPYIHRRVDGEIQVIRPASGMASALDPVMRACDGIWVAHGSGDADREDGRRARPRPRAAGRPRLHAPAGLAHAGAGEGVLLRPRQRRHLAALPRHVHPAAVTTRATGSSTATVNRMFADAVLEEVGDEPAFVFIQDFHFCLLPRMLKEANPRLIIAQFWHIPWPNREVFRTFPWGEELLDGLLGNDLLGFHVHYHCQNFLDTVDRGIEAAGGSGSVRGLIAAAGRPASGRSRSASTSTLTTGRPAVRSVAEAMERWRRDLNLRDGESIGVGIERLDYTKGIPDRIRGLDYLLEIHPEYRGRLRFIQVAVPSRHARPRLPADRPGGRRRRRRDQRPLAVRNAGSRSRTSRNIRDPSR